MHKFFQHEKYVQFYNENEKKMKMKFFRSIVNIEKKIRNFVIVIDFIKISVIHHFENFFNDRISNKKNASCSNNLIVDQSITINKKMNFEKNSKKNVHIYEIEKIFESNFNNSFSIMKKIKKTISIDILNNL